MFSPLCYSQFMIHTHRTMVMDDAGSFFRYETKAAAQSDCAKFNYTVKDFHATVEEPLDSTTPTRTYVVLIWHGQSAADYATTFGPHWKEEVKE